MSVPRRPEAIGQLAARRLSGELGIVSSLFVWAILVFVLLGLTLNEVGHVIVAKSAASNAASAASDAAEEVYTTTRNYTKAQTAALQAAEDSHPGAQVVGFDIGKDRSVTVTVEVVADTIIVNRVSALKGLSVQQSTVTSKPVSG
jgi:Flp pilus assembly protein TadG